MSISVFASGTSAELAFVHQECFDVEMENLTG